MSLPETLSWHDTLCNPPTTPLKRAPCHADQTGRAQHTAISAQTLSRLAPGLTRRSNTVAGDACLGGRTAKRGIPPQRPSSSPPPLAGTEFALQVYVDTPRRRPRALGSPGHERHAAD